MAEIPIQRKEHSWLWPLLLLVVVIAVVIAAWYFWTHRTGTQTAAIADSTATQTSNGALVTDSASRAARPPR